ncbi:MAG: OB-fold nucleic acid binding domain-containing protein, partial [Spirochaetota bacterium]
MPVSVIARTNKAYSNLIELYENINEDGFVSLKDIKDINLNDTYSIIGGNPYYISSIMNEESYKELFADYISYLRDSQTKAYLSVDLYSYKHYLESLKNLTDNLSISLVFANGVRFDNKEDSQALMDLFEIIEVNEDSDDSNESANRIDYNDYYNDSYMPSVKEMDAFPVLFKEYITSTAIISGDCANLFRSRKFYDISLDKDKVSNQPSKLILEKVYDFCRDEALLSSTSVTMINKSRHSFLSEYSDDNILFTEVNKTNDIKSFLSGYYENINFDYSASCSIFEHLNIFIKLMKNKDIGEGRAVELYRSLYMKDASTIENEINLDELSEAESGAIKSYKLIKECVKDYIPDISCLYMYDKEKFGKMPVRSYKGILNFVDYYMSVLSKSGDIRLSVRELKEYELIRNIIELSGDKPLKIYSINIQDKNLYKFLRKGFTESIILLEEMGRLNKSNLSVINSIWDIASFISLYRSEDPSRMNRFIRAKMGKDIPHFYDDRINQALEISAGLIIYKEQAFYLLKEFGGFDSSDFKVFINAINSSDLETIEDLKSRYIEYSLRENKLLKDTAINLFEEIVTAGKYTLSSMSNALTFAYLSLQFTYYKINYPLFFYVSALNRNLNNHNNIQKLLEEARIMGIKLIPININKSRKEFSVIEDKLVMGLSVMKNVEEEVIENILKIREEEGEIQGITHFCSKIEGKYLTKSLIEDFICAGAFDFTGYKRSAMFTAVSDIIKYSKKSKEEKTALQVGLFSSEQTEREMFSDSTVIDNSVEEWDIGTMLRNEKEACGFYITRHPILDYSQQAYNSKLTPIKDIQNMSESEVSIIGLLTNVEERTKKTGGKWGRLMVEDLENSIEILSFSRNYKELKDKLIPGKVYIFKGKVSSDEHRKKIFLNSILPVNPDSSNDSEPEIEKDNIYADNKPKEKVNKDKEQFDYDKAKNIEESGSDKPEKGIFKILIKEKLLDKEVLLNLKEFLNQHKGNKQV